MKGRCPLLLVVVVAALAVLHVVGHLVAAHGLGHHWLGVHGLAEGLDGNGLGDDHLDLRGLRQLRRLDERGEERGKKPILRKAKNEDGIIP